MNELIEELLKQFGFNMLNPHQVYVSEDDFKQAIQTACEAQRNACARDFRYNRKHTGLSAAEKSIKNAEIRKEDYE